MSLDLARMFATTWLILTLAVCVVAYVRMRHRRSRARRAEQAGREAVAEAQRWRCPRCGYDIRATPDQCPECGHVTPPRQWRLDPERLVNDWPAAPIRIRPPHADETPTCVWEAPHRDAADLLAAQLQADGIGASVQSGRKLAVEPFDVGVIVWSDDVERAHEVMRRLRLMPNLEASDQLTEPIK